MSLIEKNSKGNPIHLLRIPVFKPAKNSCGDFTAHPLLLRMSLSQKEYFNYVDIYVIVYNVNPNDGKRRVFLAEHSLSGRQQSKYALPGGLHTNRQRARLASPRMGAHVSSTDRSNGLIRDGLHPGKNSRPDCDHLTVVARFRSTRTPKTKSYERE
ncbi:Hypothetical predicted protein [Lecanosticta acicola]|uniref:Uncharacterized protein n=1 Tax=Lecanosticta acicola TaxID=111012 RepID=A0AAI8Z261_9PEZI|nr:Hypothetical predicted protein [Lecanosticta acicola]